MELYVGHIGYGVRPPHRGHRYAARAVLLLLPLARTLELAGAEFVEIVDVPENCIIHQNGHPRKCRYRLSLTQ
jgi:tagatose 1,6-diphosphate aldolase